MNNKNYKVLIFLIFVGLQITEAQENFQIGMYGLQSPVGTKGYKNGGLDEIKADINLVKNNINSAVAMRSWNRKKYPTWNFSGYFTNYMKEMYSQTMDEDGNSGIQVLTPNLYWIFADPVIDGTSEDEKGYNRHLSREVFRKFVFSLLEEEFKMVKKEVKSNSKTIEILANNTKRPFLGWYLDDEPLIRNHDISVIIEMAWFIRDLEKEFFESHEILSKYPNKLNEYFSPRYIAFDGDDLHKHRKSGRSEDALFYNLNGKEIKFSKNQIYTVFPEDIVDVLLIDFYQADPLFWNKIINDVELEYLHTQRVKPKIMAVIYANFKKKYDSYYNNKFYTDTFNQVMNLKIDGVWIYTWHSSKENIGAKDIWNSREIKLNKFIESIE